MFLRDVRFQTISCMPWFKKSGNWESQRGQVCWLKIHRWTWVTQKNLVFATRLQPAAGHRSQATCWLCLGPLTTVSPQGKGQDDPSLSLLSVILSLRLAAAFGPAPSAAPPWPQACCAGPSHCRTSFLPSPRAAPGPWRTQTRPSAPSTCFNRQEQVCTTRPRLLPLDHYLVNFTPACIWPRGGRGPGRVGLGPAREEKEEEEAARLELCGGSGPFTFLHFDKNFVQLCLSAEPSEAPRLAPAALAFRFVEVLLINNHSSQFTCGSSAAMKITTSGRQGLWPPSRAAAAPVRQGPAHRHHASRSACCHTLSNAPTLVPEAPAPPARAGSCTRGAAMTCSPRR